MNALIIGSGGREHALCRALKRDARLFCAPGNAGIADAAECVPLSATDVPALADFAERERVELTIVGGEAPLAAGLADEFARRGLLVAGPTRNAAQLESSKAFAKDFMLRHGVPTARHCVASSAEEARDILRSGEFGTEDSPVVVQADRLDFRGVLFVGLMLTEEGPRVLEYNVRFGDPEAQAILVRLRGDLFEIFDAVARGRLGEVNVVWSDEASACVVLAARGYPEKPETGARISGLEEAARVPSVQIFHSGTARADDGSFLTAGGRVLGVTATAATLDEALARCYESASHINWDGLHYRRDIGSFR